MPEVLKFGRSRVTKESMFECTTSPTPHGKFLSMVNLREFELLYQFSLTYVKSCVIVCGGLFVTQEIRSFCSFFHHNFKGCSEVNKVT